MCVVLVSVGALQWDYLTNDTARCVVHTEWNSDSLIICYLALISRYMCLCVAPVQLKVIKLMSLPPSRPDMSTSHVGGQNAEATVWHHSGYIWSVKVYFDPAGGNVIIRWWALDLIWMCRSLWPLWLCGFSCYTPMHQLTIHPSGNLHEYLTLKDDDVCSCPLSRLCWFQCFP